MPRFENDVFGLIPKEDWLNIGFAVNRPNDPIDTLFGDEKTDNLVARWESIRSEYQIPVMAHFHGFDTEANTTFRIPIDTQNIEKGLIKVKINQSERLRALTRAGVQNQQMYEYVMNDGIRLADQVFTRSKVAKNELLATGQVTIKENDLDLTVDYGVPEENKQFTLDLSDDVSSQIQEIIETAESQGAVITGMVTSKSNLTKLRKNAGLQALINGNGGVGQLIKNSALYAYLEEEFNISTIITNDLTYGASAVIGADGRPSITTERYFPKDRITFIATNPGGKLGTGLWGDPPELDVANMLKVNGSSVSPYVFITQWAEKDPAVLWTKASALFMPVLYNPNSLFIATVEDGNGE